MVTAEYAPFVKTGGLADAVAGLSGALSSAGHDVRVLLPDYASASLPDTRGERYSLADGSTLRRAGIESPTQVFAHTRPNEPDSKVIYTGDQRDGERFVGLAESAAAFAAATNWQPDIVHCHDWHAALVPDALKAGGDEHTPTILTLHNIGYQGSFGNAVLVSAHSKKLARRLRNGNEPLNFLRRGIAAADVVSTVSPTYAREILSPQYGMGLEDSIANRAGVLFGILNGVDYGTWDPRVDPFIESHYSEPDPGAKRAIKTELCERTDLSSAVDRPVIGIVSRLAEQKGIDIFSAALDRLIAETDAAFVVLGSGNPDLERDLRARNAQFPDRVAFRSGHDESLAHSIIAGSDYLLIPSRYEPCGLTQLYALRYGTIPIVRKTGGLADTVEHFDPATGKGNGCVFNDPDVGAILWAVDTALHWYRNSETWQTLRTNAMSEDHSWSQRVDSYVNLYSRLLQLAG
jgi:starch synthase